MTKIHDLVRIEGRQGTADRITTIAELDAQELIRFRSVRMEYRGREVVRYFADYLPHCDEAQGLSSGWQISRTAYLSRTGQQVAIGSESAQPQGDSRDERSARHGTKVPVVQEE